MAFADFLTVLVPPLLFMFHNFFQNYVLGSLGCKLEGFLLGKLLTDFSVKTTDIFCSGSLTITAVLNLCAVSYDRLTAIVLPSETRLSLFGAKVVMICTWVFGILISLPLSIFRTYRERQWKNFLETYCRENQDILPIYWHVIISVLVWVPLCVMVLCYSSIFWKLDRYEKQVLKREHPISVSYKRKVAKSLFIIVITFVVLRLPFTAMVFIRNDWVLSTGGGTSLSGSFYILWYTSHYLMFFNAAINPVIYGMTNDNFRRAYHQTPGLGWLCQAKDLVRL
jgi:7 transmembrane receptor (rhodopsin family)